MKIKKGARVRVKSDDRDGLGTFNGYASMKDMCYVEMDDAPTMNGEPIIEMFHVSEVTKESSP